MNLKVAYKFQFAEHKKAIIQFYLIIVCIFLALHIFVGISVTNDNNVPGQFNGFDSSSAIFLFVLGLCTFKESFHMMIQNGISRKTMFIGKVLTMISVGIVMALIDKAIVLLDKLASGVSSEMLILQSLFEQIYQTRVEYITTFQMHIESLIFNICLFMSFIAMGYFITILYYRLPKYGKIAISIGVPAGLFIILPVIDSIVTNGEIIHMIVNTLDFAFGFSNQTPSHAIITFFSMFIVFMGLSWLLIKRIEVKE
ncbi:hypothetical protein GC105_10190 [Alkalibaculum sp. M08DMB]|uniref:Uncharacterized protein n=1 Tax=Alkalibaculum sporogenes TaxID=2655001 RepID=A0A6A7K9J9_9FIRM|nr:hypothetical protein [Alkalibaculum sporogenes]MPW26158.1 hypothetical protein [Alkalibaculum sporogenes]